MSLVRIRLEYTLGILVHETAAEAPIQTGFVHDERVLNVITGVAHHGNRCILTRWQLVKVGYPNCFALDLKI